MEMKINIAIVSAMLSVAAGLAACSPEAKPDPEFLAGQEIKLQINGQDKIVYQSDTYQLGYSGSGCVFRVHNDEMSEYFVLTCSEPPEVEGQRIKCSLKYASGSDMESSTGMEFRVEKTDAASGMVWLWDSKRKTGVSVMKIDN